MAAWEGQEVNLQRDVIDIGNDNRVWLWEWAGEVAQGAKPWVMSE